MQANENSARSDSLVKPFPTWLIALGVSTLVAARLLFVRAVRKARPVVR
jgi:hypothetical protein